MTPQLLDIPAAEYHADDLGQSRPSLSSSIAHVLTSKSPLHAWMQHPKLGKQPREASPEMDRGTLLHALVLGTPVEVSPVDANDWRTKRAQNQRDLARESGMVPMLAREWDDLQAVAASLATELREQGIGLGSLTALKERVVVWEEQTAAGPVLCRGMLDHLDAPAILDLKTIRDAHPDTCTRSIIDHGYHLQAAAYCSAVRQLYPELAGRESFRWAFAEVLPPGSPRRVVLTVAKPSGAMRELGAALWAQACETWGRCLSANTWPAYVVGEAALEPPAWAMREAFEAGAA